MKRMYFGIGLLAALLGIGILLTSLFMESQKPLSETLEQAQEAVLAGDWDRAGQIVNRAHHRWEGRRHFIAALADHEPMDRMDALFHRLQVLCAMEQADEFTADCAELARLASAMVESQKITWWNLL